MRDPSLGNCLVESEEGAGLRSPRRRRVSLLISILLQAVLLAALLLIPLLVNGERLRAIVFVTPLPPYRGTPAATTTKPAGTPHGAKHPPKGPRNFIYQPPVIPEHVRTMDDRDAAPDLGATPPGTIGIPGVPYGIDPPDGRLGSKPFVPSEPVKPPAAQTKPLVQSEGVQQARLIRRVMPVYPPWAVQMHLQGEVRLRAVIGTDGVVREVQLISGHMLLAQAALNAVLEWRYQPTLLNGQPVEVETQITVVFTLNR